MAVMPVISIGHTHPHWVRRIEEPTEQSGVLFQLGTYSHPAGAGDKLGKISGKDDYQLFIAQRRRSQ